MRSRKVATARHCRKGPGRAYPAIRYGWLGRPPLVILETAQFRAQNDSLSLSPAHDGSSLHLNFRVPGRLSLGRPIFCPCNRTAGRLLHLDADARAVGNERADIGGGKDCFDTRSLFARVKPAMVMASLRFR
jgi:hypothetical protein